MESDRVVIRKEQSKVTSLMISLQDVKIMNDVMVFIR